MKVLRVDRILEGAVGVQEYKNTVKPKVNIGDLLTVSLCSQDF